MLNDYRQIIAGMQRYPWLITEDSLSIITEIVNKRLAGEAFSDEEIEARLEAVGADENENPRVQKGGGVGVLNLYGPMFPKSNLMTELSGATSLEQFRADLTSLVEDESVKQIVLDMDTPGGSAFMVSETGRDIRKARDVKPVYAVANPVCASAGLWLASQASKFYATESAKVGSLGVYNVHEDISGQDKAQGRKITFISAGEFKTEGNEHEPLSEKAKAYIQESVDETMDSFIEAVAEGRGLSTEKVTDDFANGKVFSAQKAKDIGMVDDILSLDEVLGELVTSNAIQYPVSTTNVLTRKVNQVHARIGGELLSQEEFSEPGNVHDHSELNPDEAAETGSRRDTPPAGEDDPETGRSSTVTNPNQTKGGEDMNEEQLAELRKQLGLSEDSDFDSVMKAITELNTEVEPVRELKTQLEAKAQFAEAYPQEAARLERLETESQERFAKTFADSFEARRVEKHKGEGDEIEIENTTLGLSALAINAIEAHAKEHQIGAPTFEGFKAVLDAIFQNGVVDYGNKGSERTEVVDDNVAESGSVNAREQFNAKVEKIMEEDKLDLKAAMKVAAKRFPQLAEAWRQPPVKS